MDELLVEILENLFESQSGSFPPHITSMEELRERDNCCRMRIRTSDTRSIEVNISENDINVMNQWSQIQQSKVKKPSLPMNHHYV